MNPFGDQHNIGLMDYPYNNFQYHQNAPSPPLPLPLPPSSPPEKRRGGKRGTRVKLSTDPQSVAARQRRHRISDRFRILKSLVPGGSKMDTVSMLEEAIHYVKFLKTQIWLHQSALMLPMDDPCHASSYGHPSTACGYHGSGTSGSGSSFASSQMFVPPPPQPHPQEMVSYSMQPTPPHPLPPLPCYYHQDEEMLPNLA